MRILDSILGRRWLPFHCCLLRLNRVGGLLRMGHSVVNIKLCQLTRKLCQPPWKKSEFRWAFGWNYSWKKSSCIKSPTIQRVNGFLSVWCKYESVKNQWIKFTQWMKSFHRSMMGILPHFCEFGWFIFVYLFTWLRFSQTLNNNAHFQLKSHYLDWIMANDAHVIVLLVR